MEKLKIREDLNDIVMPDGIKFSSTKTRYGLRNICVVKLFNGEKIEFPDTEKLYELFQSYVKCGERNFIESVKLVEELSNADLGSDEKLYICVKYTLKDGSVYRLFPSDFKINKMIDNYYNFYQRTKKVENPKK